MKKALSAILAIIITLSAFPLTASAAGKTYLKLNESYLGSASISWYSDSGEYSNTLIEKSTDKVNWSEYSEYYGGNANDYYVDVKAKTVLYFRVTCFNEEWDYVDGEYTSIRTYADPSNTIEVYPKFSSIYSYSYPQNKFIEIYWYIDKEYKKYVDGFDVFASVNNQDEKLYKSVATGKFTSKTDYDLNYKVKIKKLPEFAYLIKYIIKPYFKCNDKKIYINSDNTKYTESYVSEDIASITTKRKKVTLKLKKISSNPTYIIKYTKYNIKTGKEYKTKTVKQTGRKLVLKTDTKKFGYYYNISVKWGKTKSDNGAYLDSHDSFVLMNSASKVKKTTIKVVNTRGKKDYTDWTYKLSSSDKKTIKNFFKKKYKGNEPSRAQMAYDALQWINQKVDYDYAYKYGGLSYVDAIFNKKSGQCLQYNGAFAAVLTYLGYEARVIEGYRSDYSGNPTISHFWCEVKLNGRWYLCETGNYGKNGYWQYFVSLYRNSRGYTKNGKEAKDA